MLVGTIVKLKIECLGNPAGTRGVCYERYSRGKNEEGVSIIFENGNYDGFSPEERELYMIPVGIDESLLNYEFKNVSKVVEDFQKGIFNKALKLRDGQKEDN